jgi:acyl transferase domain-containing protein/NADPH:quinone reductase-like Zn-dependent oxidoreductase/acyl carrier protein
MTENTHPGGAGSHNALLRQALRAVEQMKLKLSAAEARRHEPIAIVGMGCRFPGGVCDPESFWELLKHGRDGLSEVPRDRWKIEEFYDPDPLKPGKMVSRVGGFLTGIDLFDAALFGIAPREAAMMDPQQRLLLEVAWEALENAGIAPSSLAGSRAGIYLGIASGDYAQLQLHADDASLLDLHFASGNAHSVASGRLSYQLGLKGPSLSIDTACSSSLVAVHLACQALRAGECTMAIAGGVNLILAPETTVALSQAQMMSPDGRCRAFDERANGFVRAEGCGAVVLKQLRKAQTDGDPILAVILATALNQDGESSSLTAPNGPSQEELMRRALQEAGRTAAQMGYVEAHGTGTSLGDPIELRALGAVYGAARKPGEPLLVGSLKTNLGHMEAAAGIGGLLKLVLALEHGEVPAHLHFETPTTHVPWDELGLAVPRSTTAWPSSQNASGEAALRLGAVSSFGFSGTNAHLIVEQAPLAQPTTVAEAGGVANAQVLPLSASSAVALRNVIERYEHWLSGSVAAGYEWPEIALTAAMGRNHFRHRVALVASTKTEAVRSLRSLRAAPDAGTTPTDPSICLLFTGQGSEHPGMGLELLKHSAAFRGAVTRLERALDWSVPGGIAAVWANEHGELEQASLVQPALYAFGWALAEFWRSSGVEPHVVLGHSLGEYIAATVAGVVTPEEGVRLVAARGRLTQSLGAPGGMIALVSGEEETRARLVTWGLESELSVAAVNGPLSVTVSGGREAIKKFEQKLREDGIRHKRLRTTHGFHSPALDGMLEAFEAEAAKVPFRVPEIRWISNVTGQEVDRRQPIDARYWCQHLRKTVQFQSGLSAAIASGATVFLEVGSEPHLLALAEAGGIGADHCIASIRKVDAGGEWQGLLSAVALLYAQGADLDWNGLTEGRRFRRASLPNYPFQRQRFWFTGRGREMEQFPARAASRVPGQHPLLGVRLRTRSETATFQAELTAFHTAHLGDHLVMGQRMLPGAAYLEMALSAARNSTGHPNWMALEVEFRKPCIFDEPRLIETVISAAENGRHRFEIASTALQAQGAQPSGNGNWTVHAAGFLEQASSSLHAGLSVDIAAFPNRAQCVWDKESFYARFKAAGLDFGPAFQPVRQAWGSHDEGMVALDLSPEVVAEGATYLIHPIALDACFQAAAALIDSDTADSPSLPAALKSFVCIGDPASLRFAYSKVRVRDGRHLLLDIEGLDAEGRRMLFAEGLVLRPSAQQPYRGWLHQVEWEPIDWSGQNGEEVEVLHQAPIALDPDSLRDELGVFAHQNDLAEFQNWMREFDALCAAWIAEGLERGGFELNPGREFSSEDLIAKLSVAPQHQRLARRLLAILCESGQLENEARDAGPDRFRVLDRNTTNLAPSAPRLKAANHPEMEWTEQTVAHLIPLLRGEIDPVGVLFSEEGRQIARRLYRESEVARTLNPLLAAGAAQAAEQRNGRIRILEVGGGTSATTSYVLPAVRGRMQEYVWTDLGASFVGAARREFASIEGMRFQTLDLERDPAKQGFSGDLFDLVIASNVIHATADLKQSLSHLRSLLAPGGLLLAAETTGTQPWIDLTVGFTDGWWRFSDRDIRPDYPLIGEQAWIRLLGQAGFGNVLILSGDGPGGKNHELRGQLVFAASREGQQIRGATDPLSQEASLPIFVVHAGSSLEPGTLARSLARLAERDGAPVRLISYTEVNQAAVDGWFDETAYSHANCDLLRHIFYLPAAELESPSAEGNGTDVLSWQKEVLGGALALIQALVSGDRFASCRVWLVSCGAFGPDVSSPDGATLSAFARSVRSECPEAQITAVDISANEDPAPKLWQAAQQIPGGAVQVAIRGDRAWAPRLASLAPQGFLHNCANEERGSAAGCPSNTRRLHFAASGLLEELKFALEERRAPASDEVEISIAASALNFHEVLSALDPGSAHGLPPGGECAGVVVRTGDEVSSLETGDRVVAIGSGLMADFATLPSHQVWKIPSGMSAEDAATLPIPFLTARWCLDRVARLQTGERVLIHAGAGGVGLAAIQHARQLGAQVFATAGSDAKREYLLKQGVEGVFDSRSTSFESGLLAATEYRGVDVVLHSLGKDMIAAGMRCLAAGGRFVELGERTVLSDGEAQALRPDVSYHRVHLRAALKAVTPEVRQTIASILDGAAANSVSPLPWKRFALEDATSAFRYMAAGRHTGRVLLAPSRSSGFIARSDGAYIVTGGFSGLGLLTVEWLAKQGAGCVLALSRSETDAETQELFFELRQAGVAIVEARCDVADEAALAAAIDAIPRGYALRGVFHAAGVLDDGGLLQQTPARLLAVLAPKVAGAWNLHRLTRSLNLDCFVLFSSTAAVFGSRGQSNHASANAYLDALAHYRRERRGLTALSVNWGAWSGAGAAVRHHAVERSERRGVDSILPRDGFRILERLLAANCTQALVSKVDWTKWAEHAKAETAANADLLAHLLPRAKESDGQRGRPGSDPAGIAAMPERRGGWRGEMLLAPRAQQLPMLESRIEERVRSVLSLPASESIASTRPLQEYGLDSLLSIELRNALASDLEVKLSATLLFDYPTLASLTNHLFKDVLQMATGEDRAQSGQTRQQGPAAQDVVRAVASLSDDEVEKLFQGKMAGIEP